jgi:hypothetical protein
MTYIMRPKFKFIKLFFTIVLFLSAKFLALSPDTVSAALLYTGAANQVVYVDQTFVVEWYFDTQGKDINSLSLTLTYSKNKLEVVETSAGNSALDLWVKTPSFDNSKGEIKLVGGISGGVNDRKLSIFRATFKPLETGNAKISLAKDSDALIADGLGTSAGIIFNEVNFAINPKEAKPALISSPTHPDQDVWYKNNEINIKVDPKAGEQYSYSFSSNLELFPDPNPDDLSKPIIFHQVPDGIYYFKLNSKLGPSDWQEAGVYRVQIDSTPPKEFTPSIAKDPAVFEGNPFVTFNTTDNISGIAYYEVKSGLLGGWKRTDDMFFKLPGLVLGDKIEVRVVDAAGNERITQVKVDKEMVNSVFSKPIFWVIIILSLIAIQQLIKLYLKLLKKYKVNDK